MKFNLLSKFLGNGIIFMLHSVKKPQDEKYIFNEGMYVTDSFLEKIIIEGKQQGYKFLSLDNILNEISYKSLDKFIVFTFDDGYKDNLYNALPILEKHKVPFTIYVTTNFPDYKAFIWWYELEKKIMNVSSIKYKNGKKINCSTIKNKLLAFNYFRTEILNCSSSELKKTLKIIFGSKIEWKKICKELALSWEEIIKLSKMELVTIGAHSVSHPNLSELRSEEVFNELKSSKKIISEKVNKNICHFAYPYGSRLEAGQREFNIAKEVGYKTATTTRWGNIFFSHTNHLFCLPRVSLNMNFSWKRYRYLSLKRFIKGPVVSL